MLDELSERVTGIAIVRDVFAYDVAETGLPQTPFGRVWLWLQAQRTSRGPAGVLAVLISFRNVLQVAISADPRYGPIYNRANAAAILSSLRRHGHRPGSGATVTVMGYSGGGQLAVGAARYLPRGLGGLVDVISVGGVLSSDPGLGRVNHLYQLVGTINRIQALGWLLWPGRWGIAARSHWNRALRSGRITRISLGPIEHTGRRAYYESARQMPDGTTYLEATLGTVVKILDSPGAGEGLEPAPEP
ncbi:MAG: hypothetical protein M3024_14650 [Candidatus Dormibacteraeota bacterium]|nr:hypothetical protein [Candidatus Dormibacteraeota bacterium]